MYDNLLEETVHLGYNMRVEVEEVTSKIRWFATVEVVTPHKLGVVVEGPSGWGHLIVDRRTAKTNDGHYRVVRVL